MSPRSNALFFFLVVAFSGYFEADISILAVTTLDFPSFDVQNFTLFGDYYLREGVVGLFSAIAVPTPSAGAIIYNQTISLLDPESNTNSSFSTRFSFLISSVNPSSFDYGLAFFFSPFNTLGYRYLGLANTFQLSPNKFVAVEFTARKNSDLYDPSQAHVGLNIDNAVSFKSKDLILHGIDLTSGNLITAWIDYNSNTRNLQVSLSYSSLKPPNPVLIVDDIDLSHHLKGKLHVGFSASTEGSTKLPQIKNWSFETFEFHPARPWSHADNVSDSSVTIIPVGIPEKDTGKKHQRTLELGVAIAGPVVFCAVLSVLGYISLRKRRDIAKHKSFKTGSVVCPREFSYRELKSATKGFHPSRIIGNGSFGTVYKAFFISSRTIAAVKRSRHTHEGETEFQAELSIIAGLRHKNLVHLQGWCLENGEFLLVYDFMPYGSLEEVLYQETEQCDVLSWSHRRNIVIGVASVLTYLHQKCDRGVIHRAIKTRSILLDGNFNARLGDFGLTKLMDHDKNPLSTLTTGTIGYLAPEYLQYGKATEKADVFSYGVVVLEVACGRRPIEKEGQRMVNLVDWVWKHHSKGKITEAADRRLNGEYEEEGMRKLLLLGLSCANPDSADRPSMRRVLQILNNEAELPVLPKMKPCLTFSSGLPLTIDELVSDTEDFYTTQSISEIKADLVLNSAETTSGLTTTTGREEINGQETIICID